MLLLDVLLNHLCSYPYKTFLIISFHCDIQIAWISHDVYKDVSTYFDIIWQLNHRASMCVFLIVPIYVKTDQHLKELYIYDYLLYTYIYIVQLDNYSVM